MQSYEMIFLHAKSNYNKIKRNQKLKFKTSEKDKLTKLSKCKPKEFWKKIRDQYKKQPQKAENLNNIDLYEHFKSLYSTNENHISHMSNDNINDEFLDNDITYL